MNSNNDSLRNFGSALRAFLEGCFGLEGNGGTQQSKIEQNRQVLLRFKDEVFKKQKFDVLENYLHPDVVDHIARPGDPPGIEGVRKRFSEWSSSFQCVDHFKPLLVSEGDYIAYTWVHRGRHVGAFFGVRPTGKTLDVQGLGMVRFRDGKIAEH